MYELLYEDEVVFQVKTLEEIVEHLRAVRKDDMEDACHYGEDVPNREYYEDVYSVRQVIPLPEF